MSDNPKTQYSIRGTPFSAPVLPPALYLVSTPIGNLADITIRGLETLAGCSVIACEDTRTSGVLLKRYGIDRPKISYTEHNADQRGPDLLRQIGQGASVALISDAGTPLVSDPGYRLVQEAIAQNISVIPIPGASAPLAALVGSGLENDQFRFCGFLPSKAQGRLQMLESLAKEQSTLIFFESPARIKATLGAMAQSFGGDRHVVVARELTKIHETFHRGTIQTLQDEFEALEKVRGEIVIVVGPATVIRFETEDVTELLKQALTTMKTKQAAVYVAAQTGLAKQALYNKALSLKDRPNQDEK